MTLPGSASWLSNAAIDGSALIDLRLTNTEATGLEPKSALACL